MKTLRRNRLTDALQDDGLPLRHFLESLRYSFVCIPEAFFKTQDFFSDYREPKVTRLDGACVDRTHCDLMDAVAFYLDKLE
jgi:hypothetical protein